MIREGTGFIIQAAPDTPWAGWFSIQKLDWMEMQKTNLPVFLRQLGEVSAVLPGGVSLLWDIQDISRQDSYTLQREEANILASYHGITLHSKCPLFIDPIGTQLNIWYHSTEMPEGELATSWCKGAVGWVPQIRKGWSLPGIGNVSLEQEDCVGCMLWGEIVIPAPAVNSIEIDGLKLAIEDVQAHIERGMSIRANAGAWPKSIPFMRRQTTWRLSITGGWEFQLSGQRWETLAADMSNIKEDLSSALKCNIHLGVNHDAVVAGILAEQTLKYGFPWRGSLSPRPAPPSFTPGIGADPRKIGPLEARASLPKSISTILSDPPVALLRVPSIPSIEGCRTFLNRLEALPAIKWAPPEMPLPGPFHAYIPWEPVADFPCVGDGEARPQKLFDWEE